MDAESREAVFAALRAKGIKAIKVVAADGSKANGEIRGIRKRVLVAAVVGTCVGTAILTIVIRSTPTLSDYTSFDARTRRQIIGDTAIIEKGIRTGWADVFELEGERFLASFAIPGVPAGQRSTSEEKLREALHSSPSPSTFTSGSDGLEARQIRAMVEGMKDEARRFVKAGGSIAQYVRGIRLSSGRKRRLPTTIAPRRRLRPRRRRRCPPRSSTTSGKGATNRSARWA